MSDQAGHLWTPQKEQIWGAPPGSLHDYWQCRKCGSRRHHNEGVRPGPMATDTEWILNDRNEYVPVYMTCEEHIVWNVLKT